MPLSRLEIALLEVLRDGGTALISDLDTLLEARPTGTGQDSVRATDGEIAPVINELVAKGLATRFGDRNELVAWTGVPHEDLEPSRVAGGVLYVSDAIEAEKILRDQELLDRYRKGEITLDEFSAALKER